MVRFTIYKLDTFELRTYTDTVCERRL
uniref:Uncharacterized protein n=1 Tax=Arundo donax TaxID=35708 RepID=A0A0A8Y522_ARUDO